MYIYFFFWRTFIIINVSLHVLLRYIKLYQGNFPSFTSIKCIIFNQNQKRIQHRTKKLGRKKTTTTKNTYPERALTSSHSTTLKFVTLEVSFLSFHKSEFCKWRTLWRDTSRSPLSAISSHTQQSKIDYLY